MHLLSPTFAMSRGAPARVNSRMISMNYNRRSDSVFRRASPKRVGVIDDPLAKGARRRSDEIGHGGGHERRASDRRTPADLLDRANVTNEPRAGAFSGASAPFVG